MLYTAHSDFLQINVEIFFWFVKIVSGKHKESVYSQTCSSFRQINMEMEYFTKWEYKCGLNQNDYCQIEK